VYSLHVPIDKVVSEPLEIAAVSMCLPFRKGGSSFTGGKLCSRDGVVHSLC
jgi:hypothetical protein